MKMLFVKGDSNTTELHVHIKSTYQDIGYPMNSCSRSTNVMVLNQFRYNRYNNLQ